MKDVITLLLSLFVGTCLGTILTRSCQPKEIITEITTTDTLIVQKIDTIKIVEPKPYRVVVRDTIVMYRDTSKVNVFLQEVKEYKDSTYYARISGINAYLEEINVYPKEATKYIYKVEKVAQKPKKWGLGVSAGMAVAGGEFQPYIGVGITYNLIQW